MPNIIRFYQQVRYLFSGICSVILLLPRKLQAGICMLIPGTFRQTLSVLLCLTIVANQVIAAPVVLAMAGMASGYRQNLVFWFYAGGWAKAFQRSIKEAEAQETQSDRDARVVQIEVSPDDVELHAGEPVVFSASAYDSSKSVVGGVKVTWSAINETYKKEFSLPPDGKFTPIWLANTVSSPPCLTAKAKQN